MLQGLKNWSSGELVIEPNEPDSLFMLPLMHKRYHWTAQAVCAIAPSYLRNWQWVFGTVTGVASLWWQSSA